MTDPFTSRLQGSISAKQAILAALAATGAELSTAQLRLCGALFGVEAAAVRVALGRLVKRGDVTATRPGVYGSGDKGQPILRAIRRWTELPKATRSWRGGWIAVHTAHLGRTDRSALRIRERALALHGFASRTPGLWLRPDNLRLEFGQLHEQLLALGLEEQALVLEVSRLADELDPAALWDRRDIEEGYRAAHQAMHTCLEEFEQLSIDARARETARIGSAVIAMLTYDPLLPPAMVDAELRREVHREMVEFDRTGKRALRDYWRRTL